MLAIYCLASHNPSNCSENVMAGVASGYCAIFVPCGRIQAKDSQTQQISGRGRDYIDHTLVHQIIGLPQLMFIFVIM